MKPKLYFNATFEPWNNNTRYYVFWIVFILATECWHEFQTCHFRVIVTSTIQIKEKQKILKQNKSKRKFECEEWNLFKKNSNRYWIERVKSPTLKNWLRSEHRLSNSRARLLQTHLYRSGRVRSFHVKCQIIYVAPHRIDFSQSWRYQYNNYRPLLLWVHPQTESSVLYLC